MEYINSRVNKIGACQFYDSIEIVSLQPDVSKRIGIFFANEVNY